MSHTCILVLSGVVDVKRIAHHQRAIIAGIVSLNQPLKVKSAHLLEVQQLQSSFGPFIEGQFGWAYFNPIHIIGGVVAGHGAFGGINVMGRVEFCVMARLSTSRQIAFADYLCQVCL